MLPAFRVPGVFLGFALLQKTLGGCSSPLVDLKKGASSEALAACGCVFGHGFLSNERGLEPCTPRSARFLSSPSSVASVEALVEGEALERRHRLVVLLTGPEEVAAVAAAVKRPPRRAHRLGHLSPTTTPCPRAAAASLSSYF